MPDPAPPSTPPARVGLYVGWTWVVCTSLLCVSSGILLTTPQTFANVAVLTLPAFVSGWTAIAGAYAARHREASVAITTPLVAGAAGFVFGLVGLGLVYQLIWPGYF